MSASSRVPRCRRRRPPPHSEQRIHHAAGIKPEDVVTGQTGSGQARPTFGGSTRQCPRDWNGPCRPRRRRAPPLRPVRVRAGGLGAAGLSPAERFASGSALQAHHALSATGPTSEKQSAPSFMPFNAACSCINRESAPRPSTTNTNTACRKEEVPAKD